MTRTPQKLKLEGLFIRPLKDKRHSGDWFQPLVSVLI
jgi:hypothetical protein